MLQLRKKCLQIVAGLTMCDSSTAVSTQTHGSNNRTELQRVGVLCRKKKLRESQLWQKAVEEGHKTRRKQLHSAV
jgi:hypothetical protein